MSKSGVFAHFGSREELQISVIREYHARFEEEVFFPAVREARGLPRLRALYERWIRRVSVEVDLGCIYISLRLTHTVFKGLRINTGDELAFFHQTIEVHQDFF
jgi:AcrR family transcriptional regulator